ncbi:unnamed protein product, partial [Didymodactylos carnosus]
EIFNENVLLYWSPSDKYLAFVKLNLTSIPKNNYLNYNSFNNDKYTIPYPKFGDPLPLIDVYVYDISTDETMKVPRPPEYERLKSDVYIFHVVWCGDNCLSVVYANRAQNISVIQLYRIEDGNIVLNKYYVEQARKGWIPANFLRPVFVKQGTYAFIVRYDQLNLGKYGKSYPQIVRIHFNQKTPQIDRSSPPNIHVDRIIHVDDKDTVYFTGSNDDPKERQLYKWMITLNNVESECLSCYDENCSYFDAQFSKNNGSYFILECLGPNIPYSRLHNRSGNMTEHKIQDNQPFRQWLDSKLMPYIHFFNVTLDAEKNIVGYGMIILPPWYNPNVTIISYPIIVSISDNLHTQRVTKKYPLFLREYYHVTKANISIVLFDGHGSFGQDEDYLKSDYKNLFQHQYDDYIKLAEYLKCREKKFNNTLNDARFGLTAIQEANVHEIGKKSLAIVHGMSDEVVHFQHSAILVKNFVQAGSNFEFKVYPDSDYYFENDRATYEDYFRFKIRFFQHCLGTRVIKEQKPIIQDDSNENI